MNKFLSDPRFAGIEPFKSKVWLSSPTMHGDEQRWVDEAIQTNWVSTVGANIDAVSAAADIGISEDRAVNYTASKCGTASVYEAMESAVSCVRRSSAMGKAWRKMVK